MRIAKKIYGIWLIALMGFSTSLDAQDAISLIPKVKKATLFAEGAAVTETFEVSLKPGINELNIKGLPDRIEQGSFQIKASKPISIISTVFIQDFSNSRPDSPELTRLEVLRDELESKMEIEGDKLKALEARQAALKANEVLLNQSATSEELGSRLQFFEFQTREILKATRDVRKEMGRIRDEQRVINAEISKILNAYAVPPGQMDVKLEVESGGLTYFEITFLTRKARWRKEYDIKAADINSPIELVLYASFMQQTGKNWENISLSFSTQNPFAFTGAPAILPWNLDFEDKRPRNAKSLSYLQGSPATRYLSGIVIDLEGNPVPAATISLPGTSFQTRADANGRFSFSIPEATPFVQISFIGFNPSVRSLRQDETFINVTLSENMVELSEVVPSLNADVVEVEYERAMPLVEAREPKSTVSDTQTNFEISLDRPMTLKSSSTWDRVELMEESVKAQYQYLIVPKVDTKAYLTAKIANLGSLGLPEGSARLYFEDRYVGITYLDYSSISDTLQLSLGNDDQLQVRRERTLKDSRTQFLSGNTIESREYTISIRNNKSKPIPIFLQDQIPVSTNQEIVVSSQEISGGQLNVENGIISWKDELPPSTMKEWKFRFEVRYPSKRKVIID